MPTAWHLTWVLCHKPCPWEGQDEGPFSLSDNLSVSHVQIRGPRDKVSLEVPSVDLFFFFFFFLNSDAWRETT